jgi:UDP-N-acetylglucosamine 2-epimerase (non-hydrolysing)
VEAGLRTRNTYSPFPEEINRRLISVLGHLHFAPTQKAFDTLTVEGIPMDRVFVTGNTVIDALQLVVNRPGALDIGIELDGQKIVLVTAHRRESLGQPLENICLALRELALRHPDILIVYPVHPNPRVQDPVRQHLSGQKGILLLEPLEYESFVRLMKASYFILTDSGGIQEEAPALGKPVLVMRDETERPEAVEAETSKIVGTSIPTILGEAERLLTDGNTYLRMSTAVSPYGDGRAAERIADILVRSI